MPRSNFQRIYPRQGRVTLDGGKNNKIDRSLILDEESPDCLNVIFDDSRVQTRGGSLKLNTAAVASYACDGLYTRHDSSGAESMVAWFGGTLWALSGTSFNAVASAQSIYTAGVPVYATEYENQMFFGNGNNIPYRYASGSFYRHGIYAPTTSATVATATTGTALSGTYQYKVTYLNTGTVESDAGPATATFTAAGENAALTSIPVAPQSWGVASRRIYRTKDGGTTFYRIATISDNTTTTYEDGQGDDTLLVTEEPDDQGVPPNYSAVIYHQGRLFMIDPSTNLVWYSEVGNPYVVKALSFRRIGDTSGDIPYMLASYNGSVVVGCFASMWLIYTPDATDTNWSDIRVVTPYGCLAHRSTFNYNNKLMFAASLNGDFVGFAAMAGADVEPTVSLLTRAQMGSDLKSNVIENEMLLVPDAYQTCISAITHKNRGYITGPYGLSQTTNNRIWYFDYSYENLNRKNKFAWAPWDGINVADMCIYNGNLYGATSAADGFVHMLNSGVISDNGVGIDSYIWTKEFFGFPDDEHWVKDWRWLNLYYILQGFGVLTTSVRIDSYESTPVDLDTISLLGPFNWDISNWDEVEWDNAAGSFEKKISLGTFRGKRIQFRFSNNATAGTKFEIVGLRLTYNLRGFR